MVKPTKPLKITPKGTVEFTVTERPKLNTYHQLDIDNVTVRLGQHEISVEGRTVTGQILKAKKDKKGYRVKYRVQHVDLPWLLDRRSQRGYTNDPAYGLRGADEAPQGWEDAGVELRERQQRALERARFEDLSIGRQVDALLEDAKASRMDVRDRLRKLEREKELLRKDLQDRTA